MNVNLYIDEFCFQLVFVILLKLMIHCRYASGAKKHKTPKMLLNLVMMYFVLSYGVWTLFNIIKYIRSPESCFVGSSNINMFNYSMLMLLGVFPLTMMTLGMTFVLVLVAMVIRSFCVEHRKRYNTEKFAKEI